MKKIIVACLMVTMVLALCLSSALASTVASGNCGANVTWSLSDAGVMTISGSGAMANYDFVYNDDGMTTAGNGTAPWNKYRDQIRSVKISSGVTSVGKRAFAFCENLTSISIPSTVTKLDEYAFYSCPGLTSVTIPSGVTSIESCAFSWCENLKSVTIPSSVTSLGISAFSNCSSLTSINLPGVKRIENGVFGGCRSLKSVSFSSNLTFIDNYAFASCMSLTSVTIPSSLTVINEGVFQFCTSLTEVNIPSNVTSIGAYAFSWCEGLKSVTIPSSVTSIGSYAFWGCDALQNMVIPSSVTSIEYGTFGYCKNLTSVTIPASVKSFGDDIFTHCTSDLIIFGKSGSAAETYAKNNKITFIDQNNLSAPKLTSATADTTSVTIKWEAVTGAAKYRVFYKTAATGGWKKLADTTATSYKWTGAASDTTYTFTVRCISADGKTFTSSYDTKGLTVTFSGKLATPKIGSVTGEAGGVTVKWGAVSGAAKYRVFYKNGTSWKKLADTTSTSYKWTAAEAGTTYTFTVRCVSSDGNTFTSDYDTKGTSYTVPAGKLATPKISSVTGEAGGVTIKWGAVSGAAKYRVFYKNGTSWKKIADTTSTSYKWTAAKASTTYTFTVRCVSADGNTFTSDYDTKGTSYTVPVDKLATPKISSVTGEAGGVTVKWGAVTGAAKYRVFYKCDSGWKKIADTTSTSYKWTAAEAGKTYTFTVRCVSSDGATFTSDYDTKGTSYTVPAGKLATPKLSSVTYDATGVTVKWGVVSGAAKYRVFYKTGSNGWKKIADTASTSYVWKSATNGTKYTFTVRCVSSDGNTFTSDYDTTGKTITYTTTLGTPKISSVNGTAGNVTIKWGAVAGAAKYRVFYKTSTGWKKITDTTSTSYTWTGAAAGTYTFTVRCVTSDGSTFTSSYDASGKSIQLTK